MTKKISPVVIVITAVFALILAPSSHADVSALDIYGDEIRFEIVRNEEIIGTHISRFEKDRDDLVVSSRLDMKISFLFFPVYSFEYQSRGVWRSGQLSKLTIAARDGSDRFKIEAEEIPGGMRISGPSGIQLVTGPLIPTNHWNAAVLEERRVLNTLTGNVNEVVILDRGMERIPVSGGVLMANRFDYTGDLTDTSVWYDARGRWVGLQFKGRDGSLITYRCTSCEPQS